MEYTELPAGEHTFQVRAIDEAGNFDTTPESYTWTVEPPADTTPPETTILSGPSGTVASPNASFTFSAEAFSTFECSLDNEPLAECESPAEYTDLLPGPHTFSVAATDASLNVDLTPATRSWTVIGPPETTIDLGPATTSPVSTATFTFSSDQPGPGSHFFCSLDGLEFSVCSSGVTYFGLIDGDHTFEVAAQNTYALTDETPALYEWTVAVPPNTTILDRPDAETASTSAMFTFNASEIDATFECSLDAAPFAECESPVLYPDVDLGTPPLAIGAHDFEVRAIDDAGNVDATPASWSWTVVGAPETTIDSAEATSLCADASFTFCQIRCGTFQCSLDGSAFADCTSPRHTPTWLTATTSSASGRGTATVTRPAPASLGVTETLDEWTVPNTPAGTDVTVEAPMPGGIETPASVTFSRSHRLVRRPSKRSTVRSPLPATYYAAGSLMYDIDTTAHFTGPITVCLGYDPASVADPSALQLLHFESGSWTDVTTNNDPVAGHAVRRGDEPVAVRSRATRRGSPRHEHRRRPGEHDVRHRRVADLLGRRYRARASSARSTAPRTPRAPARPSTRAWPSARTALSRSATGPAGRRARQRARRQRPERQVPQLDASDPPTTRRHSSRPRRAATGHTTVTPTAARTTSGRTDVADNHRRDPQLDRSRRPRPRRA